MQSKWSEAGLCIYLMYPDAALGLRLDAIPWLVPWFASLYLCMCVANSLWSIYLRMLFAELVDSSGIVSYFTSGELSFQNRTRLARVMGAMLATRTIPAALLRVPGAASRCLRLQNGIHTHFRVLRGRDLTAVQCSGGTLLGRSYMYISARPNGRITGACEPATHVLRSDYLPAETAARSPPPRRGKAISWMFFSSFSGGTVRPCSRLREVETGGGGSAQALTN